MQLRPLPGLLLGLVLAVGSVACTDAPIRQKYAARTAVDAARASGAARLAPQYMESAQDTLDAGARELDSQLRRMSWSRDYSRAEALFVSAQRRAEVAQNSARRQLDESRTRARTLLRRAGEGFEQMTWVSVYIPPKSSIRSDVSRARVSFTQAKNHFGQGEFAEASNAAHHASRELDAAYARFSRYLQATADPGRSREYARWVNDTIAWSAAKNSRAIIVDKMRRTLSLVVNGRREKTYRAELGVNGTLDKVVAGDRATPEGKYRITEKRGLRQTRWYKALLLNYPNDEDLARFRRARQRGQVSRRARPGGLIEIHGEGGRGGDWTDGCVALVNRDIDDLFDRVSVGTPVTIVGFESDDSMRRSISRLSGTASRRGAAARGSSSAGGIR